MISNLTYIQFCNRLESLMQRIAMFADYEDSIVGLNDDLNSAEQEYNQLTKDYPDYYQQWLDGEIF